MVEVQAHRLGRFFTYVFRDLIDVRHQLHRLLKRHGVDALHQIGLQLRKSGAVIANIGNLVGVIYVSVFDFLIGKERRVNAKSPADLLKLFCDRLILHQIIDHGKPSPLSQGRICSMIITHAQSPVQPQTADKRRNRRNFLKHF